MGTEAAETLSAASAIPEDVLLRRRGREPELVVLKLGEEVEQVFRVYGTTQERQLENC